MDSGWQGEMEVLQDYGHIVSENYERIMEGIASACAQSGRKPEEITFVAVTKFVPMERIAPALGLGITNVGENRAQEMQEKLGFFKSSGCAIHFIGQLQTNKVKYIIGQADLVQSVDRIQLAQELERQADKHGVVQDILAQVNIGREPQKGGIPEEELPAFLSEVAVMPHLRVKGLMCVPPEAEEEEARVYFARMRKLFEVCSSTANVQMRHLSMGMSGDYRAAVKEGATMVRIGSALFGPRITV